MTVTTMFGPRFCVTAVRRVMAMPSIPSTIASPYPTIWWQESFCLLLRQVIEAMRHLAQRFLESKPIKRMTRMIFRWDLRRPEHLHLDVNTHGNLDPNAVTNNSEICVRI